jgi:GNAT superfamily N-acetyltransferase
MPSLQRAPRGRSPGDPGAAVSLRDGLTVHLRPVRAGDAAAIRCLFQGLSETSTWLRFFTVRPSLDRVVGWATEVDDDRRLGLVAIAADSGQLIAHAGLERDLHQPDRAEFAVAVADHHQGRGLGRVLLGQLIQAADHAGIRWLTGEVLTNNRRMLHLLRHSGCSVSLHLSAGVVLVELPTFASPGVGMVPAA